VSAGGLRERGSRGKENENGWDPHFRGANGGPPGIEVSREIWRDLKKTCSFINPTGVEFFIKPPNFKIETHLEPPLESL
jgi:hypothetical protein